MRRTLALLLPALIPSWRFFKTVAPSPRLQYRDGSDWRMVFDRPRRLSLAQMLRRLFWNPDWNAQLYMVTLSERLAEDPTPWLEHETHRRAVQHLGFDPDALRLIFVYREGDQIVEEELYRSHEL